MRWFTDAAPMQLGPQQTMPLSSQNSASSRPRSWLLGSVPSPNPAL